MSNSGLIIVISSPSGGGKTSAVKKILDIDQNVNYSISATTRPRRPDEKSGIDYIFLTQEEFDKQEKEGNFIETTLYNNQKYGTPKDSLMDLIDAGKDVLLDIDVNGGHRVKEFFSDAITIFLAPPSWDELEKRLKNRGSEVDDEIKIRLDHAKKELKAMHDYDYIVINDNFDKAVHNILSIITAERCRRERVLKKINIEGG